MGAQAAAGLGADLGPNLGADLGTAILVSAGSFACAACGSPAVTWPADPTAEAAVACGGCARPLGTLAAFRAGIEGILAACQPRKDDVASGRREIFEDSR